VTIRVMSRRDVLHGEITDNGRGFRPGRASSHATRHIGLATVRERLEMAGGRLDVASTVGEGTTVRFWIPLG
jgi:signal transduction histidine kinase